MTDDLEEQFVDPNGPAYIHTEIRTGPPLSYVAEKVRYTVEAVHDILRRAKQGSAQRGSARAALSFAVRAYLALLNNLAIANAPGLYERLEAMERTELLAWLDRVERGGSALGY